MPSGHEQAWADALAEEHLHQRELLATLRGELGTFARECAAALTALDAYVGLAGVAEILSTAQTTATHARLALDVSRRLQGGEDPELVDLYTAVAGGEDVPPRLVRHASDLIASGPKRTDRQLLEAVVTASGARAQLEQLVGPAPAAALAAMKPLVRWIRADDRRALLKSAGGDLAQVLSATAELGAGAESAAAGDAAALGQSLRDAVEHVEGAAKSVREGKLESVLAEARAKLQADLDALQAVHENAHEAPAEWRAARKVEHTELTQEVHEKLDKIERIRGILFRLLPNLQAVSRALGVVQKLHALEGRLDPAPAAGVAAAQASLVLDAGALWDGVLPGPPPAPRVRRVSRRTRWVAVTAAVVIGVIVGIALAGGGSNKPKPVVIETTHSRRAADDDGRRADRRAKAQPPAGQGGLRSQPARDLLHRRSRAGRRARRLVPLVADDAPGQPDLQQVRAHAGQAERGRLASRPHGRLHPQRHPARRNRARRRSDRPLVVHGVVFRDTHPHRNTQRTMSAPLGRLPI